MDDDRVKLLDLKAHHCRWPLGDPTHDSFRFCGARRPGAGPYCAEHAEKARAPHAPRASALRREDRQALFLAGVETAPGTLERTGS